MTTEPTSSFEFVIWTADGSAIPNHLINDFEDAIASVMGRAIVQGHALLTTTVKGVPTNA